MVKSINLKKNGTKHLVTIAIILINIMRKPQILYHPRFYAEEGQSFFSFAYNNSFIDYIFSPMFGYYTLYNLLATSFACMFKLETAPLITTYLALIIQVATSMYVLWCDIPILNSNVKKYLVAISFPLLCHSQIWLTTIGVQYWLCIITSLILLEGAASRIEASHIVKSFVLLLTGLTGVLSCFMTPAFILKSVITKSKQFLVYSIILLFCSILQICVFLLAYMRQDIGLNARFVTPIHVTGVMYKSAILYLARLIAHGKFMDLPFVYELDAVINDIVVAVLGKPLFGEYEVVIILSSIVLAMFVLSLVVNYLKDIDRMSIVFSSLGVFFLSVALSINGIGGPRYIFAPNAMLMVFIISAYNKKLLNTAHRIFAAITITLIFTCQVMDFRPSMKMVYNDEWPKWEDEVRLWRMDSRHPLNIWPPPWQMNLK